MRRSNNRSQSDLPHAGHVAAIGAKLAALLSQKGIRHTALTRDHIIWTKEWNTLTALGWRAPQGH